MFLSSFFIYISYSVILNHVIALQQYIFLHVYKIFLSKKISVILYLINALLEST